MGGSPGKSLCGLDGNNDFPSLCLPSSSSSLLLSLLAPPHTTSPPPEWVLTGGGGWVGTWSNLWLHGWLQGRVHPLVVWHAALGNLAAALPPPLARVSQLDINVDCVLIVLPDILLTPGLWDLVGRTGSIPGPGSLKIVVAGAADNGGGSIVVGDGVVLVVIAALGLVAPLVVLGPALVLAVATYPSLVLISTAAN